MTNLDSRLERCFQAVFPKLSPDCVPSATSDSVPEWDSVNMITLLMVVQEEFGIHIEPEQLPELGSFQAIREYLMAVKE